MKIIKAVLVCGVFFAAGPAFCAGETAPEVKKQEAVDAKPAAKQQYKEPVIPAGVVLEAPVPGYRGMALSIAGDQLLYLKRGDRVDVLSTFDVLLGKVNSEKDKVTATILQNILVLNVRQAEKMDGTGAVELLLNPQEAQYLALSAVHDKYLNLIRRAPGDVELHPMEVASFRKLIR
jgi:hypothetical protein